MPKTYRIAIVGCGRIAAKTVSGVADLREHFHSIIFIDPNPEARQRIVEEAKKLNLPDIHQSASLSEALTDYAHIDLVAISTPPATHYSIAREALEAGAHLLLEKPAVLKLADGLELIYLAKQRGLKIATCYIYRFYPGILELSQFIQRAGLGELCDGRLKIDWGHDQAYYDAAPWRGTWEREGGVLLNQSVHGLDLINFLSGHRGLLASAAKLEQRCHQLEAEDSAWARLGDGDGFSYEIEASTAPERRNPQESFETVRAIELQLRGTTGQLRLVFDKSRRLPLKFKLRAPKLRIGNIKAYAFLLKSLFHTPGFKRNLRQLKNPHAAILADTLTRMEGGHGRLDNHDLLSGLEEALSIYAAALDRHAVENRDRIKSFDLCEMRDYFKS
ncbi:MAG: Gfo/Idh/MocA family oxidoreductase [Eubacteriales bacterium]|nr:Gfo/Idh/MocA family oxidoreductase [Eubacteriales bacterium]